MSRFKFPWFNKSQPVKETKSTGTTAPPFSLAETLMSNGYGDLSFHVINSYYKMCDPLSDVIDSIAQEVSRITPIVVDTKTKEPVDHDVLDLLSNPNTTQSQADFMFQTAGLYLLMGSVFNDMIGNVKRPPLSIDVVSPAYTNVQGDATGELGQVMVNTQYINDTYTSETVHGRNRFYTQDRDKEIWPSFRFNPERGSNRFYGVSKAQSLFYKIQQCIESGKHNTALLQNGARPGGIFTSHNEMPLTTDQIEAMQNQLDMYYAGSGNAGRPLMLEHFEYKETIVNNRDMDWQNLMRNTENGIYKRYDYPLPLVNTDSMTFSNYEGARVALYDNAILPVTDYLFCQLGLALFPRYGGDWQRYKLTYDETKISALQARRTENIKTKKLIAVNTVNELRSDLGDDPYPGGNVILGPANQIPILETDTDDDDDDDEKERQNAVDANGDAIN